MKAEHSTCGGETTRVTQTKFFFQKFFSKKFSNVLFFKNFFPNSFCLFVFLLVCCQAFCLSVATGVPGRQALAGRETVEDAGGTAGIVGCAVACACGAATR